MHSATPGPIETPRDCTLVGDLTLGDNATLPLSARQALGCNVVAGNEGKAAVSRRGARAADQR